MFLSPPTCYPHVTSYMTYEKMLRRPSLKNLSSDSYENVKRLLYCYILCTFLVLIVLFVLVWNLLRKSAVVQKRSSTLRTRWVSEKVSLYTAHYKQKVASAPQSRQTEMLLKVVWTAQIQCSVFAVWGGGTVPYFRSRHRKTPVFEPSVRHILIGNSSTNRSRYITNISY